MELLLAFGADPVVKDGAGNTAIHIAAASGSPECLKLLAENVRNKDDLNEINDFGEIRNNENFLSGSISDLFFIYFRTFRRPVSE